MITAWQIRTVAGSRPIASQAARIRSTARAVAPGLITGGSITPSKWPAITCEPFALAKVPNQTGGDEPW